MNNDMSIDLREIETRFRRHAVRLTRQRAAIYAALVETTEAIQVPMISIGWLRQQPMMSRNTVYYTLGVLRNAGLDSGSQRGS